MARASHLSARRRRRDARGGLTLIELVIVATLLVVLAAIAIPSVQMAVEGRRVREAARAVNVYLGAARNRAMATGGPVGVAFERFGTEANMSITLHQVESPPDYAGETMNARAEILRIGLSNAPVMVQARITDGAYQPARVQLGDLIQFNHQGPWYEIFANTAGLIRGRLLQPADQSIPWSNTVWSAPVPYTIRRQPKVPGAVAGATELQVGMAKPLQLPLDAVVDLTFSGGTGSPIPLAAFSGGTAPVVIMFSPNGALDRIYYGGAPILATEPVYLLIGKRERIPPGSAADGLSNLRDPENLWVSISPRTGLINTVENALVANDGQIGLARQFTQDAQSMGGR